MHHNYINSKGKIVAGNAADNHYVNTICGGLEKYTENIANRKIKIYKGTTVAFAACFLGSLALLVNEKRKAKKIDLVISENETDKLEDKSQDKMQNKKSQR